MKRLKTIATTTTGASFGHFTLDQVAELVEAARAAGAKSIYHRDGKFDGELCFDVAKEGEA